MLEDLNFQMHNFVDHDNSFYHFDHYNIDKSNSVSDDDVGNFQQLLNDSQRKLYYGCSKSLLSFPVKFLDIRGWNRMTNKCYDMIIDLFNINHSPFYEARKVLKYIALGYKLIHA